MNTDQFLRLSCPKCAAGVKVAAHLAGKRLKCPKCGSAIKVPGIAPAGGEDDDWLGLEGPVPTPTSAPSGAKMAPKPVAASGPAAGTSKSPLGNSPPAGNSSPAAGSSDVDWLDDLPPLAPEEPRSASGSAANSFFGTDLPPLSDSEMAALSAAGGFHGFDEPLPGGRSNVLSETEVVNPEQSLTEYRAKCPVCESIHYVKPKQAGKEINCGDCFSPFVVPPPPKVVPKKKVDISRAPTFQLSEVDANRSAYAGPEARSAAEYLRQAEDEDFEEEEKDEYETPDIGAWLKSMFGIFLDPSVLAYWVALSALGAVPGAIAVAIGNPILGIGLLGASFFYLLLVVACGFAIMESASGGLKAVAEWPMFNPAEWMGQAFFAMSALVLSSLPGAFLGFLMFGPGLALLATSLISIFLIFPFVILSMLDNGSVFMPISGEVTKSITRCKESWGGVYFSSMLLFGAYFVSVAMLSTLPPVAGIFIDCFLTVGLIFVYFSMLGGLAYQIGQAINAKDEEVE